MPLLRRFEFSPRAPLRRHALIMITDAAFDVYRHLRRRLIAPPCFIDYSPFAGHARR